MFLHSFVSISSANLNVNYKNHVLVCHILEATNKITSNSAKKTQDREKQNREEKQHTDNDKIKKERQRWLSLGKTSTYYQQQI